MALEEMFTILKKVLDVGILWFILYYILKYIKN